MILSSDAKLVGKECREDISTAITNRLNQINFCFDGMGNLGTLVNVKCSDNDKTKYMLKFRNQHFLKGKCKENGEGPNQVMFLDRVAEMFNLGDSLKKGKVPNEKFKPSSIEITKQNLASYIRTEIIEKPDSLKYNAPIMFWWETEEGKQISKGTARIMHAAIKSAALHGKHASPILIFSNSLPSDYFCKNSILSGWEASKTLPFTCRANIVKYNISEILFTLPNVLGGIVDTMRKVHEASADSKGYMHTMSDVVRFVLLYRYGGTYMDFDQIFIRPLPEGKIPLISREMEWTESQCNLQTEECKNNPGCFASTSYCREIGVNNAVPGQYGNPPVNSGKADDPLVFSLYSGLLAGFQPRSPLVYTMLEMVPTEYKKFCWGCLGPNLVTKAFGWLAKKDEKPPAFTLSSNDLLMIKHAWQKNDFSKEEFNNNKGAVVDIDFHSKKGPKSMLAILLKMTLFAKNGFDSHESLLDLVDEKEFQSTVSKDGGKDEHLESNEFAKLPWLT